MKKRVNKILAEAKMAVLNNPVEVLLSLFFCLFGCLYNEFEDMDRMLEKLIFYFPMFFLSANVLNRLTVGRRGLRAVYYLSVASFLPFFWVEISFGLTFFVSLVVVQLLYLISRWERDNDGFMQSLIRYLMAVISAFYLAGAAWLLSVSIYYSIRYIFDVWQGGGGVFMRYLTSVLFLGVSPLLFLMFGEKKEYGEIIRNNRLLEILLNYVLSPALLAYGVILFVYFLKIAVQWSLPKGDVAYIVVSFTTAGFLLRGCQSFLTRRYFDWFYRHLSLIVAPALTMYWVGTCYRINQYGFTEPRVYLVVVGLILTAMAVLFLSQRWGRYLYVACLAAGLLSVVTYIPGVTAKDIETASQSTRGTCNAEEEIKTTVSYINYDGAIDIEGFRAMQTFGIHKSAQPWVSLASDSLYIYEGGKVVYAESEVKFLQQQLARAGLAPDCDSIAEAAYPQILRLDMDSATVVFESMAIERDTTYALNYLNGRVYLER